MIEERFRRHRHAEIILSMRGFGVISRPREYRERFVADLNRPTRLQRTRDPTENESA